MDARIVAAAESTYTRHPAPDLTTEDLLTDAFIRALSVAGIDRVKVDGLGVASFTLRPDHVADLAWRLGLKTRWLMEDTNGGAAALNMLQHARRAVEAEDARTVVLLAGDRLDYASFSNLVNTYNRATTDHLATIPFGGPNALFALLTQRHMHATGLTREDYGRLVIAQRAWAGKNPAAVYRRPLSLDDYLNAPVVATPLTRYDCVPVVSGADAIVITKAPTGVAIRSIRAAHNIDAQRGDGLHTGLSTIALDLWNESGFGPDDVGASYIYDDYPAMVLIQLEDLGMIPDSDPQGFLRGQLPPLNTSGGQLSAGQAGAAGGMHGLVEAVRQLLGDAPGRETEARRVVVTGYGMLLYRYCACANAATLEGP